MVDLGAAVPLSRVRLNWEAAYAKDYELQVSNDGTSWTTVRQVKDAQGGVEEQEVSQTARYVRVLGRKRATPYGISLWELQVFDSAGSLVSQGKRATASSMEDDQVPSRSGSGSGRSCSWPAACPSSWLPATTRTRCWASSSPRWATFLQLQNLGLVPWGFRQTSAVVLIVVGLVILLQSQRRSERADEGGAGPAGDAS